MVGRPRRALSGASSSTGGWRTPPGSPRTGSRWLGSGGSRGAEGQLLRLLGDIAAHPDRVEADTAKMHYRQALALANELGLRPLAAQCHLGLGVLYRRAGTRQEAREHLTTAADDVRRDGHAVLA